MSYDVRISDFAASDIIRLAAFLKVKSPRAANAAVDAILDALETLRDFPLRGRLHHGGRARELSVAYGAAGYVIQYRVGETEVLVLRIFHAREDR